MYHIFIGQTEQWLRITKNETPATRTDEPVYQNGFEQVKTGIRWGPRVLINLSSERLMIRLGSGFWCSRADLLCAVSGADPGLVGSLCTLNALGLSKILISQRS